jgi:molybdopterin synthase catalytic subunit
MVRGYREERERQETEAEQHLCNGSGEREAWRENGGALVTFKGWLKAHKRSREQLEEIETEYVTAESDSVAAAWFDDPRFDAGADSDSHWALPCTRTRRG